MKIVPVTFKYAKEFVSNYHRHIEIVYESEKGGKNENQSR